MERKPCQTKPCWGSWSSWSPECPSCSDDGKEIQMRWRRCLQRDTKKCKGSSFAKRKCNIPTCADGWNSWGDWSECPPCYNLLTDKPSQKRSRTCKSLTNENCNGKNVEARDCEINACTSPSWSDFSDWSPCSVTCGFGTKKRTRTCSSGKGNCLGLEIEMDLCTLPCDF